MRKITDEGFLFLYGAGLLVTLFCLRVSIPV